MANNYTFPRAARLLSPADFKSVFDDVTIKVPSSNCLLLARHTQNSSPRLGFIISKKNVKHAVARNRVKRHSREFFRTFAHTLPPVDIIFMARKGIDELDTKALNAILTKQFNKLKTRSLSEPS